MIDRANAPEELIQGLLNNPYESIILVDKEGNVKFVNNKFLEVYKDKLNVVIGQNIRKINPISKLPEVLANGKEIIYRSQLLGDNNLFVFVFPIRNMQGNLLGAAGKIVFIPPKKIEEMQNRIKYLETQINAMYESRYSFDEILGKSKILEQTKQFAKRASQSDSTVLILGESGTGKELFAHSIHKNSTRANRPFIRMNCSCIPTELIESELFGYEPGAFTGASKSGKQGKFELANSGTIFFDEIGDMSPNMQLKLLSVLEEKEFTKIGGTRPQRSDFRLICATNKDINELVKKETFRSDLYYRINILKLRIPPLRNRKEDILLLANHFFSNQKTTVNRNIISFDNEVVRAFNRYLWPGNIRELRNVVERAHLISKGSMITIKDLPKSVISFFDRKNGRSTSQYTLRDVLFETERIEIIKALEKTNNNKKKAAEMLGIHRTGLYQKFKKFNLAIHKAKVTKI